MQKFLTSCDDIFLKYRYFIWFILLLPAFFFRDFTIPTELKYVSMVDEALRNNTLFTFYNHGEAYADKPPLYFWLLMLGKQITGKHMMLIIGLFSLLPAIGIAVIMDKWFKKFDISHNPVISNLLLITTALFLGLSVFGRMDMMMCFFIVLSLYTFFRIYKNEHSPYETWLFPVYIFLAIFSKGPFGFMIPVASIVVFLIVVKKIRTIGNYFGLKQCAVLCGLCAAWFLSIYWEGGNEYLNNLLFKQTVGRGIDSFAHKEPIWYYFPRLLWSFAPWTILYIAMIVKGIRNKLFASDSFLFFVVIMVTNIVMLSLISAKVDVYLMPIYPFVVYLCSAIFHKDNSEKSVNISLIVQAVIFVLFFPCLLIAKKYVPYQFNFTLLFFGAGAFSISGLLALWMIKIKKTSKAVTGMGFGMILLLCAVSFSMPQLNKYIGFREMAEEGEKIAKTENIEHFATYRFGYARNMDVFLNRSMERIMTIAELDSLNNLPHKTILYVRKTDIRGDEALSEWLSSKELKWEIDENCWYIVGGNE